MWVNPQLLYFIYAKILIQAFPHDSHIWFWGCFTFLVALALGVPWQGSRNRKAVGAIAHLPQILTNQSTLSQPGGKLFPPYQYLPRLFRPSYGPSWLYCHVVSHWHSRGHWLYNEKDKKASYFVATFLHSYKTISCQYSNLKNILEGNMKTWRNTVIKRNRKMG